MTDADEIVWHGLDVPAPVFTAEDVRAWTASTFARLTSLRLLVRADNADHVVCPACEERHVSEVQTRALPDGRVSFFIHCPESLRVRISDDLLLHWTLDFEAVGQAIAAGLRLSGRLSPLVCGRLWRLGKTTWQDTSREVVLARGLGWDDDRDVAGRIGGSGMPIVLVGSHPCATDVWPDRTPAIIPLSRVASLSATGIEFDRTLMATMLREADEVREASQLLPPDPKQKKLLVRKQLKAEIKSFMGDEEIKNAYLIHGSVRATAQALGISKDKVSRALLRHGGAGAIRDSQDSNSVRRTVASQRRDKRRRIPRSS